MEGAPDISIVRLATPRAKPSPRATSSARRSPPQLEVVRLHLDAYNRRDLDAIRALSHAEFELDWSASRGPLAGVYCGVDALIGFCRDWFSTFEEVVIEPERLLVDGRTVLVPNVAMMRGRDGIAVIARSVLEFTVNGSCVTRLRLLQSGSVGRAAA